MKFEPTISVALAFIERNPTAQLFPIYPGRKMPPLISRNLADASNDVAQLKTWHRKWTGCNWGCALNKSNFVCVDVDCKLGKVGLRTWDAHDVVDGWPPTMRVRTPSGGWHDYYTGPHTFALGEHGFGKDVDVPNYTLIPGCTLAKGGKYELANDLPVVPAAQWMLDLLSSRQRQTIIVDASEALIDLDLPGNINWTIKFLREDAPPSIEGDGGEFALLKIAMSLRDMGISYEMAVALISEHYNIEAHCKPTWEAEELETKVRNGYSYASKRRIGEASALAEFTGEDDFGPHSIPAPVRYRRIDRHRRAASKRAAALNRR